MTPVNIAVLGDGGWGTALTLNLYQNHHNVTLWGPFPENLQVIDSTHTNPFLKGVMLPEDLKTDADPERVLAQHDYLVLAAPSQYMRGTLEKIRPYFDRKKHFLINIAKGIEVGTLNRMSQLCTEVLGENRYGVLSGPSHAEEVSKQVPTAVVAASQVPELAKMIQQIFMNERFRVYTSRDVTGVELGGSLKNVYAIATGIIDGMALGDNPKAAMMTRAIAELSRLGILLGGQERTFAGLSGIGDLIVTCMSRHSRNRYVGEELGKGRSIEDITNSMGRVVAEGVKTAESARLLARKMKVETPLVDAVYDIINNGKVPKEVVMELMNRRAKQEYDD